MKYGETAFDILYLLTAAICGILMLARSKSGAGKKMGWATLILGAGDAFHLIPRVIRYFSDRDLTAALGIGKLITSLSMTVFYVLVFYIWIDLYHKKSIALTVSVWILFAARTVLCLFPQNGWTVNSSDMTWGVIRNIPFVILGVLIVVLFIRERNTLHRFRFIWLYVTLSFLFYIPVAVAAGILPILGMLMLPKTVCYVLIVLTFLQYVVKDEKRELS